MININYFLYKFYNIKDYSILDTDIEYIKILYNNEIYFLYYVEKNQIKVFQYYLFKHFYFFNYFVNNIFNKPYTLYKGKTYILLKCSPFEFNVKFLYNGYLFLDNFNYSFDWLELWCNKIDYIGSFYKSKSTCFDDYISSSFDYYICLAETAITLLNRSNIVNPRFGISFINYDTDMYKNPLNTKIDIVERNFSEYLRILFYEDKYLDFDFSSLISKYSYLYNYTLVLVRLLFPHNFFCLIDKMYYSNKDVCYEIKKIISRADDYMKYIRSLSLEMKKYQFVEIDI